MDRRLAMAALLALTLVTSGCLQAVTGDTVTFEASPATVDDQALDRNGFALNERDTVQVNQTVEVPVLGERDVRITNHVRAYGPEGAENGSDESTPAAMFVVSTPQAQVAGQGTNPLGRVPLDELVSRVASQGGGFEDMERVDSRSIDTLGTSTSVVKYSTTTTLDGQEVETFVYVTRVAHGSDYVIAVAMLPAQFSGEESTLFDLMRNLEHADGS